MDEIKEGTSRTLTVSFKDKAGAAATPSSVQFRVDCDTTGLNVRPLQAATPPAASMDITLVAADNVRKGVNNPFEIRRVTVIADFPGGNRLVEEFRYQVLMASTS